jgi:hypothetical protein
MGFNGSFELEGDEQEATPEEATELLDYAYFYLGRGELEEAGNLATEAKDMFEELQMAGGNAEARWILGFIQYQMGEYKNALPLLASAQQQFGFVKMIRQQCATLYLLSHCHFALDKPSKSIYTLKLAISIMEKGEPVDPIKERANLIPDWETLKNLILSFLNQLESDTSNSSKID